MVFAALLVAIGIRVFNSMPIHIGAPELAVKATPVIVSGGWDQGIVEWQLWRSQLSYLDRFKV